MHTIGPYTHILVPYNCSVEKSKCSGFSHGIHMIGHVRLLRSMHTLGVTKASIPGCTFISGADVMHRELRLGTVASMVRMTLLTQVKKER